jgi:hypothetical protein
MKDKSIGKRIGLAFAAAAIGFVAGYIVFIILGLIFPPSTIADYYIEIVDKALGTAAGLGLMIYLAYRWSGKRIASIAAAAVIIWIILQVVVGGMFMWSSLSVWPNG